MNRSRCHGQPPDTAAAKVICSRCASLAKVGCIICAWLSPMINTVHFFAPRTSTHADTAWP